MKTQGFRGYSDQELKGFHFGVRFAYILCVSIVILGLILANVYVLGVAMFFAFLGSVLPFHPFDIIYNRSVRHWIKREELPLRANQLRFACGMATVHIGVTIYFFAIGQHTIAYILGGVLVAVAMLVSTTDICIPSIMYNAMFERKKGLKSDS